MTDPSSMGEIPRRQHALPRRLGLWTATAVVVAEVIGVGIFLTAAGMVKSLGSPFWLLLIWTTTGLAAVGGALCFGALAARRPEAGGPYVYLQEAYGPRVAFLFGWLSMLVTDPGITAALAVGVARYVGYLVPLSDGAAGAVAVASIWLLAAVNIRGVAFSSGVIRGLAVLKLGVLGFLVLWGLGMGHGAWSNFVPFFEQRPGSEPLIGALVGGMIAAFFSLGGWWDVSKIAGEVRDPGRTVPRALLVGVLLVTLVYVLICLVFLYLVPAEQIGSHEAFAALAGEALFGRSGGVILSSIVIVTVLGSLAAVLMAMPRVYFAMARDGLFFPTVAALHRRYQTPARAILIQAVLSSLLAVTGTFDEILAYFIVPTVIFLALTVATCFVFRRKTRPDDEPLKIPWYPLPPLLFLIQIVILVGLMIMDKPGQAGIGLAVVALGLPGYSLVFARRVRPGSPGKVSVPSGPAQVSTSVEMN
jgi:basic amino acid/polyamine antiporter, APA family